MMSSFTPRATTISSMVSTSSGIETLSRTATRLRSAPAASSRATTVFSMESSPTRISTPPASGRSVVAGTQGICFPRVTFAAMSIMSVDLAESGWPSTMVNSPSGMQPPQSHSGNLATMPDSSRSPLMDAAAGSGSWVCLPSPFVLGGRACSTSGDGSTCCACPLPTYSTSGWRRRSNACCTVMFATACRSSWLARIAIACSTQSGSNPKRPHTWSGDLLGCHLRPFLKLAQAFREQPRGIGSLRSS